jgi:hypothetical protein
VEAWGQRRRRRVLPLGAHPRKISTTLIKLKRKPMHLRRKRKRKDYSRSIYGKSTKRTLVLTRPNGSSPAKRMLRMTLEP